MASLHERYMQVALGLARRHLGRTWPNPAVGAVIVKNDQIIAQGVTANGGRPHAETIAIASAGGSASGACMYVTLEPCSHHGKTPPCAEAIINSGISKVVVACGDSNPKVGGKGIEMLKDAGIEVVENICRTEAQEINRGFFSVIEKKRPYVALKIATSADNKITSPGQRWLTGEQARNYGHLLRARYDAILTGSGTIISDDPLLTCRLPGLEGHSPVRIVLDRMGRVSKDAKIFGAQDIAQTWVLQEQSVAQVLEVLAEKGITRLLVEAGAKLSEAFMASGLVDRVYWFSTPVVVGETGLAVKLPLASYCEVEHITLGQDNLRIYECSQE